MVSFHSYVSLPEGTDEGNRLKRTWRMSVDLKPPTKDQNGWGFLASEWMFIPPKHVKIYGNETGSGAYHIIMFPERQAIVVDLRQNHVSSDPKWIYGCTQVCCYPEMPFEMSCFMRYDMCRGQKNGIWWWSSHCHGGFLTLRKWQKITLSWDTRRVKLNIYTEVKWRNFTCYGHHFTTLW